MRSTTVAALLVASVALISREETIFTCSWIELTLLKPESPAAYAATVPFQVDCSYSECRIADNVRTSLTLRLLSLIPG
jgi:hypothetical protein